jgi:hypothetical protein
VDENSGAALQALKVDKPIQFFSVSDGGTFPQTNRGLLYTRTLPNRVVVSRPNLVPPVFVKDQPVTRGKENALWRPSEYRPMSIAIHGRIIGFGCPSGQVSFIEIAF